MPFALRDIEVAACVSAQRSRRSYRRNVPWGTTTLFREPPVPTPPKRPAIGFPAPQTNLLSLPTISGSYFKPLERSGDNDRPIALVALVAFTVLESVRIAELYFQLLHSSCSPSSDYSGVDRYPPIRRSPIEGFVLTHSLSPIGCFLSCSMRFALLDRAVRSQSISQRLTQFVFCGA